MYMTGRAAFFDIDGTLTATNVWKGLMDYFTSRGQRRLTHAAFTALHYPLALLRPTGLISEARFRSLWAAHLPWYFRDYDAAQMRAMAEWVSQERVARVARPDVLEILRGHLAAGDTVVLVSGAPEELAAAIARMWGVPHAIGSPAEVRDGRYSGRMAGPPCIDAHKAVYVRQYVARHGLQLDLAASLAYADSYADLGLFELVGHPVAVYPDDRLAAHAARLGWRMVGR